MYNQCVKNTDSFARSLQGRMNCRVHSLEFHKTSHGVYQLLSYLCCQRCNVCLLPSVGHLVVFSTVHFGISQGAIQQPPVGTTAESNSIIESADLSQSRFSNLFMAKPVWTLITNILSKCSLIFKYYLKPNIIRKVKVIF